MYQYTAFDQQFVRARAAQYRDQLERNLAGTLGDDEFRPLRLQNGWYIQRYAPMLRVAVPYGELNSAQLRVLATIARDYDKPAPTLLTQAQKTQDKIDQQAGSQAAPRLTTQYGHFTTRQNVQFNWIKLEDSADVMELLASVNAPALRSTKWSTRAPTPRSCGSGARCTPSSLTCHANSRSRSPAPWKIALQSSGTT